MNTAYLPPPIYQWDLSIPLCQKPCRLCERNKRRALNLQIHLRIRTWRDYSRESVAVDRLYGRAA